MEEDKQNKKKKMKKKEKRGKKEIIKEQKKKEDIVEGLVENKISNAGNRSNIGNADIIDNVNEANEDNEYNEDNNSDKSDKPKKKLLTQRKIEYLVLAALGLKNNAISKILNVSLSTVKKTLEDIFYKLKAKDRTNMVNVTWEEEILTRYTLRIVSKKYGLDDREGNSINKQ